MLFDGDLSPIGEIPTFGDVRLTAEASAAYYPVDVGYARYGITGGRILERALLRHTPPQLRPLPDGERLLVFVGELARSACVGTYASLAQVGHCVARLVRLRSMILKAGKVVVDRSRPIPMSRLPDPGK